MKSPWQKFILFLFCFFFFHPFPSAALHSVYMDPLNGDNRNPGISSATAIKGPEPIRLVGNDRLIRTRGVATMRTQLAAAEMSTLAPPREESQLERIILGPRIVSAWNAFAPTIWQAPLEWQQYWSLAGISIDGTWLQEGCAANFLETGQYYRQQNVLYINNAAGNPDSAGKTITVYIQDDQTNKNFEKSITGWSSSKPSVWQAEFPTEPIHLFIDDLLFDQSWWYGPLHCMDDTGQEGYLYLRDSDGNPDDTGKTPSAIVDTGGWSATSGDFNGDGFKDVVHSNSGPQIYINYGASVFPAAPSQILTGPDEEAVFGFFVAAAGDVNNDGYDDLLVAMSWGVEKVYLYMGSASGLNHTPPGVLLPPVGFPAYGFGHGIAGNGDINGDGYSDILIMGGDDSSSYLCEYLGTSSGIHTDPDWVISFADKIYGGSACIVGDMNKDGYDDVALSVSGAPPVSEIGIRVYSGSSTGALANPRFMHINIPEKTSPAYGEVAPAGDVNSDGFADLVVGNQWADGDTANEGEAYLFLGSAYGPADLPDFTIANPRPEFNARFGSTVAGIGDFDRNGHSDLAVGCPYSQDGDGFVAIYSGSAAGISNTPERTIAGVNNFGWSVSGAGDIKGTGQIYMVAGEEYGGSYLYATPCDTLYYADDDKDGYGDPGQTTLACIQPPGYASDNSDCNDAATEINPGAEEACNGVDDNCDGHVDEGCPQPVADAGTDKQVVEGDLVKLDGSASTPAEASRQITAYSWTQIDGPGVSLSNAGSARASFMTPPVHAGGAVLHFQLTVEDTIGLTATDEVTVTIQDNGIAGFPDDVLTFMGATGHPMGVKIQGGAILLNVVPVDPSGLLAADNSPDALIYGLLDITVWVPTPGSEADVTFYFSSPAEGSHVWCRYNSVDGWSDYSAHSAFDADRRSITIHLVDGENGDDDHCANNIIENESGLGVFSLTPAGDDTDPGSGGGGGGGGCFINALKDIVF